METRPGLGLGMQQVQRLVMTPEMRQAMTVLQLPSAELEQFISQQLLENPVLEVQEHDEDGEAPLPEWLEDLGTAGDDEPPPRREAGTPTSFEAHVAPTVTLQDYLASQLSLAGLEPLEQRIGHFLIGNLDDHGYLTVTPQEAAAALSVPPEAVARTLAVLQTFDPAGVGARDLRECLRLQWASLGGGPGLVTRVIDDFLGDLAEGRLQRIADSLGVTAAAVQAAADAIRRLDPKPGRRFGRPGETRYIVPDLAVERVGGGFVVVVNDASAPRLTLNAHYREAIQGRGELEPDAKRFLEQRLNAAIWLIKSIEKRRLTLYRVMESIVRLQRPFFEGGLRRLRPLTLKQVADDIGLHESTVSRAASGKYVQTPHGVFELKFFFPSGVEGTSAASIKRRMRDLISRENPARPLSDDALAAILSAEGIAISRRTVTKYREEMQVPASSRRRRF